MSTVSIDYSLKAAAGEQVLFIYYSNTTANCSKYKQISDKQINISSLTLS